MIRVLIAEDTVDIAENIGDYLTMSGHQVDFAYDGKMAVDIFHQNRFDIIVMDVMMPKLNGFQATQLIRQHEYGDVPIIMLTAKDQLDDKLSGFDAGADDYLVKPFSMVELEARIQAQVRRSQKSYKHVIEVGHLRLDQKQQTASFANQPIVLNPTTFKIIWLLAKQQPNLVEKTELEFALWGELKPEKDILRSHIYNLRKALENADVPVIVQAKHGQGYQLLMTALTNELDAHDA